MWQVLGSTSRQIAKLSLVTSTVKEKGSKGLWQTLQGVQLIQDNSNTNQWHYVDTKSNPDNDASKGMDVTNVKKVQRWYNGSSFLWQPEESWSLYKDSCLSLEESDLEIKHEVKVNVTRTCSNSVLTWLEERVSDWTRIKCVSGIVLKYIEIFK